MFSKCKDCKCDIKSWVNMVMVNDALWNEICDSWRDLICDKCMEKRMGREINELDFKECSNKNIYMIPCNAFWLETKNKRK